MHNQTPSIKTDTITANTIPQLTTADRDRKTPTAKSFFLLSPPLDLVNPSTPCHWQLPWKPLSCNSTSGATNPPLIQRPDTLHWPRNKCLFTSIPEFDLNSDAETSSPCGSPCIIICILNHNPHGNVKSFPGMFSGWKEIISNLARITSVFVKILNRIITENSEVAVNS